MAEIQKEFSVLTSELKEQFNRLLSSLENLTKKLSSFSNEFEDSILKLTGLAAVASIITSAEKQCKRTDRGAGRVT